MKRKLLLISLIFCLAFPIYCSADGGESSGSNDVNYAQVIGVGIVGGLIVSFLVTGSMLSSMNTAREKTEARNYIKEGSFNVFQSYDNFIYEKTEKTEKPKEKRD